MGNWEVTILDSCANLGFCSIFLTLHKKAMNHTFKNIISQNENRLAKKKILVRYSEKYINWVLFE